MSALYVCTLHSWGSNTWDAICISLHNRPWVVTFDTN